MRQIQVTLKEGKGKGREGGREGGREKEGEGREVTHCL